jgi:AcrR family transcriptional regulator
MTERGSRTRSRLIVATTKVVQELGYTHATVRAIAQEAGVAEGTLYRHFPDKAALFFAAVLEQNTPIIAWVSELPARAGRGSVEENLTECLRRLRGLQEDVLPLELALRSDPELSRQRQQVLAGLPGGRLPGPPDFIAEYLTAEQSLGRLRPDVNPAQVAVVALATLLGLALLPSGAGVHEDDKLLKIAMDALVHGITS